jgi:hypothetical protein
MGIRSILQLRARNIYWTFWSYLQKKRMAIIVYQTFQHVSGYNSAIKDCFSTNDFEIKPEIDKMLKEFFGGYQRKIA